ncbi:MAG TPA: DUF4129 domain-containing protein, partial [Gaiellales bacterium]|nr:DUF4129 domain-containing protein [Gaiellales bacterium]
MRPSRESGAPRVQVRAAAAATAMAVLLAVAALGSNGDGHGSFTPPGSAAASSTGHHVVVVVIVVLAPILGVLGLALFLYAQVHRLRQRDADSLKKIKRRQAKAAVSFLLIIVGVALWMRSGRHLPNFFGGSSTGRGGPGTLGRPGSGHPAVTGSDWTAVIVIWVLLAAAAVFVYLRYRASRRSADLLPLPAFAEEPGESEVARLRRELDPRRAVIAAYAAMERLMARDGVARGAHEAPMEYLGRVTLHGHHRVAAVHRLTALF